ncbi:MAG TPA: multidrug ABC transporter ATP-binding protein, partial [Candidatus Limnocylindria bacterium]|nr:multidrug ABC transporter ATP-binding protein [Candidatus Limnocylindria bacterium]
TGVLLQDANLLLLDEPTNHLDIQSKEILLNALRAYQGTIIFVSHDRDFVNSLSSHILELTPHGAYMYAGNYDTYAYQKKTVTNLAAQPPAVTTQEHGAPTSSNKELFELRKKSGKLESKIEKLEDAIRAMQDGFEGLAYGSRDFESADQKLKKLKLELQQCMTEWEEIQEKLD